MKLIVSEGEKYPHWFLRTREDTAIFNPESAPWYQDELDRFDAIAVEVPDDLARKWLAARDAWAAVEEEIGTWQETQ